MSEQPFWTFSLRLYRTKGVAPACVSLQDNAGVDVNVLLFALWLAANGRRISLDDLQAVEAAVAGWRHMAVAPLRAVRRALRNAPPVALPAAGVAAFRDRIKAVELEAERLQQDALFGLRPVADWGGAASPQEAARMAMDVCETLVGRPFPSADRAAILDGFQQTTDAAPPA